MRIGLVARADSGGLGTISEGFWRALRPEAVLIVDHAPRRGAYRPGRYAEASWLAEAPLGRQGLPQGLVQDFCDRVDVVYSAETFYDPALVAAAGARGVATVLHAMPEFYAGEPATEVWVPTGWRADLVPGCELVPIPVDVARLEPRIRTRARRFLHLAGKAGRDRDGTRVLADAIRHITESVRIIIVAERSLPRIPAVPANVQIEIRSPHDEWHEPYAEADVLIAPRRYGGLSLPMLEAAASGCVVLASDLEPQAEWVLDRVGIADHQPRPFITKAGHRIRVAEPDPIALAEAIDALARRDISGRSKAMLAYAGTRSWAVWSERYRARLEAACASMRSPRS